MSLSGSEILCRFDNLNVWVRGDERAPHKPLLILLALARVQSGADRFLSYETIDRELRELLISFGPKRKSVHPEYPFWRLQKDGVWEIPEREQLVANRADRKRTGDIPKGVLLRGNARGGFTPQVFETLSRDPSLIHRIAANVLENHFPPSLHDDILDAVGFQWVVTKKRARDPAFRELILRAYEHRCAVCGYDGRLGHSDLGLEAAHVKWHAAGGPDTPENGLALCSFHHKVFDRGAVGLDGDRRILVSSDVYGQSCVDELLFRYVGKPLRSPQGGYQPPARPFVAWHYKEVFRQPERQAA